MWDVGCLATPSLHSFSLPNTSYTLKWEYKLLILSVIINLHLTTSARRPIAVVYRLNWWSARRYSSSKFERFDWTRNASPLYGWHRLILAYSPITTSKTQHIATRANSIRPTLAVFNKDVGKGLRTFLYRIIKLMITDRMVRFARTLERKYAILY